MISNQLFIVYWAISIFANDIFFFPWGRFNSESCYSFCPHSSNSDDISGVDTLVMSLNWMTSTRLISIQEAVHEIDRLSLTLCSDNITSVSLLSCAKLRKSSERKRCYGNRDVKYEHYSLDRYFYEVFIEDKYEKDEDSGRVKDRILLYSGLNCRPCHPIDFNYARGMLIMHKPWNVRTT